MIQPGEFCRCGLSWSLCRWKFMVVEGTFAMGVAMVIDVPLCERGSEPAHERAAARVGSKRRAAIAIALCESEEVRVERPGEVFAQ